MKLYRHYKNKNYRYIGVARHSETLDEVVIYECLYENDLGTVWVRPKTMFHETISDDGKTMPRFRNVPLKIEETSGVSESNIRIVASLAVKCFGEWNPERFFSKLKAHDKFHLLTAFVDEDPVGFKLGYPLDDLTFYSWLGGVAPDFRGLGIADELMSRQHAWCREQGYKTVRTKTRNKFREMLMLNLRHGFEIAGTNPSNQGGLKIVLEKSL